MQRFYFIPVEANGAARGPKYLPWKYDPDPPALVTPARWAMMDYGLINAALLVADVTTAQHTLLSAQANVAAAPEDIDSTITTAALTAVKAVLDALSIPTQWVQVGMTYRYVMRMVAGLFQFAQRHAGLHGERLIDTAAQLELRWDQVPLDRRQRVMATADALGYDYSGFLNTWLVKRILYELALQWGATPILIGGVSL